MTLAPLCPERQRISKLVVDTVADVYALLERQKKGEDKDDAVRALLVEARAAERSAARQLTDHVKEHGCKLES